MITNSPATARMWLRRLAAGRARCVPLLVFLSILQPLHAAEPADPSSKLREQLRGVMLQLRTAQTDAANAQAAQATAEAANKDLAAKITELEKANATLTKRSNTEKAASDQSIATLEAKVADRDARIVQFTQALEHWKEGYQKAAEVARTKEEERAKLASQLSSAKLTIADRERKNIALFNVSNEILDRYQGYALGKALAAREPFIGTTRVKVENLVQGYQDKILDNRIQAPKDQ
ncbi:MAG: phage major capsid protein [Verrucomicrobiota bacterium]